MMYFVLIAIFIIIVVICFKVGGRNTESIYKEDFKESIRQVSSEMEDKRQAVFEKQFEVVEYAKSAAEKELQECRRRLEIQKENYEEQIKIVKDKYNEEERDYNRKIKRLHDQCCDEVEKANTIKCEAINQKQMEIKEAQDKIEAEYKERVEKIESDFQIKKIEYNERIKDLNNKLEEEQQNIQNLIDQFKKDEEARKEKDFYRINLSDAAIEDVAKLKVIAATLNSPIILYKLIWKEYYEAATNSMIGNVLGENKDKSGIYKITNIESQKVYIGQSTNVGNRLKIHIKRGLHCENISTDNKLYSALWEEGPESFTFQLLETCPKDKLNEREKFYISFYNAQSWGYNTTKGNG